MLIARLRSDATTNSRLQTTGVDNPNLAEDDDATGSGDDIDLGSLGFDQ